MADMDFSSLASLAARVTATPEDERTLGDWRFLCLWNELLVKFAAELAREGWQEASKCLAFAEELQAKRGRPLSKRQEAKRPKASSGKPGRKSDVSDVLLNRIIKAERGEDREPQQAELAEAISDFMRERYGLTITKKTLQNRLGAGRGQHRGPQSRRK